jgi:hypothetical protein
MEHSSTAMTNGIPDEKKEIENLKTMSCGSSRFDWFEQALSSLAITARFLCCIDPPY